MLKKIALRILKKSTELLTFSGVEKSQYKVGHQGRHYLSIHSTFCPITGKLPQFKHQSATNIFNIFPSRCACMYVLGVNSGPR